MAMYDTVHIEMQCPYCNEKSLMEFQTKDLNNELDNYKVGDYINDKFNNIDCVADCFSKTCREFADKRDIINQGIPSGFGRLFDCKIRFNEGHVTNDVFDIELDDKQDYKWLEDNREKWENVYVSRK